MSRLRTLHLALGVIMATAIGMASGLVLSGRPSASSGQGTQESVFLNQRLRVLEQRLYTIESSINQLQQAVSSQRASNPPSGGRDPELIGLRSEVDAINRRLIEIECGLVKLDERTSTPATREALKRMGDSGNDRCRLNAADPLRLSSRP
jgi:hypothetical protein